MQESEETIETTVDSTDNSSIEEPVELVPATEEKINSSTSDPTISSEFT